MKNYLLKSLAVALLLAPALSFAGCPSKVVSCVALDTNSTEQVIQQYDLDFKGINIKKDFFTALVSSFKCSPCVTGCGNTVNHVIDACDALAKKKGYAGGYLNKGDLSGVSLSSAVDSAFDKAQKAAETAAKIGAVAAKAGA